jgi:hypothetical protein
MALVLPTPQDLVDYKEGPDDAEALQRAGDLFTLATGITNTPTDPLALRLIEAAILEMAWYLQTNHEDLEAEFSPFSSERIGSYSYSKMQQAAAQGIKTGVPAFDIAVAYFATKDGTITSSTTEWVFKPTGVPEIPRHTIGF